MARLLCDAYHPKCQAPGCKPAATYVCEWDQQRGGRTVSGRKLYCGHHACNFAFKHEIYMAALPDVPLSQLETASRDDWKYSDELKPQMNPPDVRRINLARLPCGGADERRNNSVSSVPSVAKNSVASEEES